jgi:precorrin-6B methylase 2
VSVESYRKSILLLILIGVVLAAWRSTKHKVDIADVPYVETPPEIVELMLDLGEVDANSKVYDLGSGDGRITIAAARRGAQSTGVEIDEKLVNISRANARKQSVEDRAEFIQSSLFDVNLSDASVVTLFLSPRINRELQPKLLSELRPGTKVVSHIYDMEGWVPDKVIESSGRRIFLWTIPERTPRRSEESGRT